MEHFKSISALHRFKGYPPPENPLLSVINCKRICAKVGTEYVGDFYTIGFKKIKAGEILYGRTKYDHEEGSMFFIKPRQAVHMGQLELEEDGFVLHIHEDFFFGHHLHDTIKDYGFFDYEINEALHLSPKEEGIIWDLYTKIECEYHNNQDRYSRDILLSHIDSILKYSLRFYKRQFINRTELGGRMVTRFNDELREYFDKGEAKELGLPSVYAIAERLCVSPRYLSDLLKEEIGMTAMELIHLFLITEAKHLIKTGDRSIAEIAYALGFENPPYFFRLFKKTVGLTPSQFKKQI